MLLTHSIRPLTLAELSEAMVIDYEGHSFDPEEHRLTNPRQVLEICSSLLSTFSVRLISITSPRYDYEIYEPRWLAEKLSIERQEVRFSPVSFSPPKQVVQFAHFSVKEYMMLERTRDSPKVCRFGFSSITAHQSIAAMSLVYLGVCSGAQLPLRPSYFEAFPFMAYAARHWPEHWRSQLSFKSQETIDGLIQRIMDPEPQDGQNAYANFINVCPPDVFGASDREVSLFCAAWKPRVHISNPIPQPLYYAALLGHQQLCRWLVDERGGDINAIGGTFGHAIQAAAFFGSKEVVEFLLDHGANMNLRCGEYGFPLHAAVYGGHADVANVLLNRGAAVEAIVAHEELCIGLPVQSTKERLEAAGVQFDCGLYGDNVECTSVRNKTALAAAAGNGDKALAQLLLRKGADINNFRGGSGAALDCAARAGSLDMVKMLVAAGAYVNPQPGNENSPLQAACEGWDERDDWETHLAIVEFLLKHGADPNIYGGRYGSALQAAIVGSSQGNSENLSVEIIKMLLDHGAEINPRGGEFGLSPLIVSLEYDHIPAANLLLDRGVELDDDVLLSAIGIGEVALVRRILEKGADVNAQNKYGTALYQAIYKDDLETIEILLGHPNIDVNAVGNRGTTALSWATAMCDQELVKKLLARGADANPPTATSTCLAETAMRGDMEILRLLLDHGADVNTKFPRMNTALMEACARSDAPVVKFLLDRGADASLWVEGQGDALKTAASVGDENIVGLLLTHGANVKTLDDRDGSCLESAIRKGNYAVARLLLDAVVPVNPAKSLNDLEDSQRHHSHLGGPLTASIEHKDIGLTRLLIERGANVNWLGYHDLKTPLESAIDGNNEEAARLLLAHGADVNLVSGKGSSNPLCCAIKHENQETRNRYIRLLLDAGACVNIQRGTQCPSPLGVGYPIIHFTHQEDIIPNKDSHLGCRFTGACQCC